MKLSICIPTHSGRCDVLREALDSILAQARQPLACEVEIVVSDNASQDGTRAMVQQLAADAPLPIRYFRNDRDIKLANLVKAVERAQGEWCWLFGSDDVMAEDALEKLTETITRFPDSTGIGFWKANFSADLRDLLMYEDERIIPPRDRALVVTDREDAIVDFAFVRMVMSCSAFRRDRWLAAAALHPDAALEHPDWPQLVIGEEATRRDPVWVWLPAALVRSRTGTAYIIEEGSQPDLAGVHSRMMRGLHRLWGTSYGPRSDTYLRLMRIAHLSIGSPETVMNIKGAPGHRYRAEPALIAAFIRAFWRLPEFRRQTLPLLLAAGPLWRLRTRTTQRRLGPPTPLPAEDAALPVRVTCEFPPALPVRAMPTVRCRLRNDAPWPLTSAGPNAVAIAGRVFDAEGALVLEGVRTWLREPLAPGAEVSLDVHLLTPWDPGVYTVRLAVVQTGGRWTDDVDLKYGASARVEIHDAPLPEAEPAADAAPL